MRELRLSKNLTLRQVSTKSNVSLGHLCDIERGESNASNEILEAIARGLDVTTVQLIKEIYEYLGGQKNE